MIKRKWTKEVINLVFKKLFKKRKEAKEKHNIFNEEFKNYIGSQKTIFLEVSAMCKGNKELTREVIIKVQCAMLVINFNNLEPVKSKFTALETLLEIEKEELKELLTIFFEDNYDKIIEKLRLSHNLDCY